MLNDRQQKLMTSSVVWGGIASTFLLKLVLDRFVSLEFPFLLFLPAIALSAWCGSLSTGLMATIASVLINCYYLIDPTYTALTHPLRQNLLVDLQQSFLLDAEEELNLGLFLLEGGLLSSLLGKIPFPGLPSRVKSSEPSLSQLLNVLGEGVCLVDRQWQIVYLNAQAAAFFQHDQAALSGKILWEVLPDLKNTEVATQQTFEQFCQQAISNQTSSQFQICCGFDRWLEVQALPMVEGMAIAIRDITERKQMESVSLSLIQERDRLLKQEQAVRDTVERAERQSAFLAEASKVLSLSLDHKTILTSVTDLLVPFLAESCLIFYQCGDEKLWAAKHQDPDQQIKVTELAQQYLASIPHSSDRSKTAAQIKAPQSLAVLKSDSTNLPLRSLCENLGMQFCLVLPMMARSQPLGAIVLMATTDRYNTADLSLAAEFAQRASIAIDNAQLHRQAQMLNRAKDEFLTTLSHELRTPLHIMLGWAQLLRTRQFDDITQRAIVTIERNARIQAQLVDDLLTASRATTGRLQLKPHPVDFAALVRWAIEPLLVTTNAKSIQLTLDLDTAIGRPTLDPRYMRQVIWHLLSNAIKFTPKGGQIQVQLTRQADDAQLQVTDTGEGICPEFLPYVFDRFHQADSSTTRPHGGMGLGLAIVAHLVELHGGSIVASSPGIGKGATFTVRLPMG